MANHAQNKSRNGWAPFLHACRPGYDAVMRGDPWPKDFSDYYEWGRLFAVELLELGDAPKTLDVGRRMNKAWTSRLNRCTAFRALCRQYYARQQETRPCQS